MIEFRKIWVLVDTNSEPNKENSLGILDSEINPKYALPHPEKKKWLRFTA